MNIKYQLTIITNFLLLLGLLMSFFYINSFDKVLALMVSSSTSTSSLSTLSLLPPDLAAINSGNPPSISHFNLTPGYRIEPVMWNLTLPSSVTFDDKNNMYISEAGFVYGGLLPTPRISKIDNHNGNVSVLVDRNLNGPITDIEYYDGKLYVSHRGVISTVEPESGLVKDIIVGLPSLGDHHNNQIAIGPDNRLYFGQGEATNSGVVGEDNFKLGWTKIAPQFHDIPAKNVTLTGQNFVTNNTLTAEPNDTATTGAFVPFGTSTYPGQVIQGNIKCNGCILSANLDGTDLKLIGWGLRNPTGLAFNEEGRLFAVNHGADQRGSRPIANDSDKFYEVKLNETAFYGWPDFFGNAEPVTDPKFKSPRGEGNTSLQFLMQNHPSVEKPLVLFEPPHTSGIQMTFANESFGFAGEAFVGQMGTDAPISRSLPPPGTIIGQNVVHVNIDNKTITDFLTLNKATTSFRPTDVVFSQNGTALFIVDWGNLSFTENPPTTPYTGVVWKITPTKTQ